MVEERQGALGWDTDKGELQLCAVVLFYLMFEVTQTNSIFVL